MSRVVFLSMPPCGSQSGTRTKGGICVKEANQTDRFKFCRPVWSKSNRSSRNARRRERKSKRNARALLLPKILVPSFHKEPYSSIGPSVIRRERTASGETRRPSLDMEPAGRGRRARACACAAAAGDDAAAAAAVDGITPWPDPSLQPGRHERGRRRE